MRLTPKLLLALTLLLLPLSANAQDTATLFCRPNSNETWVGRLELDFEARTLDWADQSYSITYLDSLYVIAVSAEHGAISAISLLIERDTGAFWRSGVGRFCDDAECTRMSTGIFADEGTCRVQGF